MRITVALGMAVGVAIVALAAPASAMPAGGLGGIAAAPGAGLVARGEFRRRPDGTVFYRRPRFDGKGPYLFYYRGYAYPYYPGYAYRAARGELKSYDRPHRLRVVD